MLLTPFPPVTNCHTFSDPTLERDGLYGRPFMITPKRTFLRQRILYRGCTIIAWCCILVVSPAYISELFVLSLSCPSRRSLRSASRGDYLIPRFYTATKQNRAFS